MTDEQGESEQGVIAMKYKTQFVELNFRFFGGGGTRLIEFGVLVAKGVGE